jgi:hypothetical protein
LPKVARQPNWNYVVIIACQLSHHHCRVIFAAVIDQDHFSDAKAITTLRQLFGVKLR